MRILFFLFFLYIYTKDICLLRLNDINVQEFFSGLVWENIKNGSRSYVLSDHSQTNLHLLKSVMRYKYCDMFNIYNSSIKIEFGVNPKKILEFLKVFNIKEMGYFVQFLELLRGGLFDVPEGKNGTISVRKLWKFYFDTNPDNFKNVPSISTTPETYKIDIYDNSSSNSSNNFFSWNGIWSFVLGGSRKIDLGSEIKVNREEYLTRLNLIVILSRRAYEVRKQYEDNPPDLSNRTRP